jgi:hypothetical protein
VGPARWLESVEAVSLSSVLWAMESASGMLSEGSRKMKSEEPHVDPAAIARRLTRLAADRTTLFRAASVNGCLTREEHARLTATEQQLDECFNALRRQRALRDTHRFDRGMPRRPVGPPAAPRRPT